MKRLLLFLALLPAWHQAYASYNCDGTNDRLELAAAVVPGYPFTVAGWLKAGELGTDDMVFSLGVDGQSAQTFRVARTSLDAMAVVVNDGTSNGANTGSGTVANTTTWYHVIAVFASSTDRRIYLDGANESSTTVDKTPSASDNTIFCETNNNASDLTGKLAHWAVWDIALDATARTALAGGANPLAVEAADLISYWPMTADAEDDKGANDLTVTGATLDGADNPTVDDPPSARANPLCGPFCGPVTTE